MQQLLDYLKTIPEPDQIAIRRRSIAKLYENAPWPTKKFIDYEKLFHGFSLETLYADKFDFIPILQQDKSIDPKNTGIFFNGELVLAESNISGVEVLSYDDALDKFPSLLEEYILQTRFPKDADKLSILTQSGFTDGIVVYVHPDTFPKEKKDTNIFYLYQSIGKDALIANTYVLLIIGKNNDFHIVSERLPVLFEGESISFSHEDIFIDENVTCDYLAINRNGEQVRDITTKSFYIGENSSFSYMDLIFGGKSMRQTLDAYLDANNANFQLNGISFAAHSQIFETITLLNNCKKGTEGRILYKNLVSDTAKTYFEGLIKIEKGADFTNSYLEDHTILLSENAVSESIPGLEIEAKEVRASHGATIGTIDKEQMFYAESRGMSEKEAIKIITFGFLRPILDRLQDAKLEERIVTYFNTKLG